MGYLREYLAFAPAELGPVMPPVSAAPSAPRSPTKGGDERWGLDAVFCGHACACSFRTAPGIRSTRPGHRWTSRQASATR